jgi:hypothetical protein
MASGSALGRVAHGLAGADWPGGQPLDGGSRLPISQIGGKEGGTDNQVDQDAGKEIKVREIHALVDSEGLPMRIGVYSAAIQDRDGAGLASTRYAGASPGSTDPG